MFPLILQIPKSFRAHPFVTRNLSKFPEKYFSFVNVENSFPALKESYDGKKGKRLDSLRPSTWMGLSTVECGIDLVNSILQQEFAFFAF